MKTLSFLSRNIFLFFTILLTIIFLGSCENILEQPIKKGKTDSKINYELSDCISISPGKMKVLYIGVANPILIDAPGVNRNSLKISVSGGGGGTIKRGANNQYIINVTKPAPIGKECEIQVSAKGINKTEKFRVKRIPNPFAKVGGATGGDMGLGEFKAQGGVAAILDDFDFDAKCKIQGYVLSHIRQNKKFIESINKGPRYSPESQELINDAQHGDIYTYHNVKAKCPGDPTGRKINSMVFKIK